MTSSSRRGTNSSTSRRSSASSTDSTRSTGRSVRIPGPYAEGPPPKRRRVIGSLNRDRDAEREYFVQHPSHSLNCPLGTQLASVNRVGARNSNRENDLFGRRQDPLFIQNNLPVHVWTRSMNSSVAPVGESWPLTSIMIANHTDTTRREAGRRFVRDFARWRMHPGRGYGRMHRDSRSNWIENGGGLVGEHRERPTHRARKPARPVRNRRS